jgi:hypothetical protein
MGTLLTNYKSVVINEILTNITSNTSQYYAFVAGPVPVASVSNTTLDDYSSKFLNEWELLFGKKLSNSNILPVMTYNQWISNTVYEMYDNTKDLTGTNYYAITSPTYEGGSYNVFKCIYNNGGAPSTELPDQLQSESFTKSDGYIWRYITSISSQIFSRFSTDQYVPIISNPAISSAAYEYTGVEVVVVTNGGNGYSCYTNGTVQSVINSTCFQIGNNANISSNYYSNNGIYFYNTSSATAQLTTVASSFNNSSGNFVITSSPMQVAPANTNGIQSQITLYNISPAVVFNSDASPGNSPAGYTIVNTSTNSISSVVMVDNGTNISWCNVSIVSNSVYGFGATAYAIVPPPGGHGYDPVNELDCQGFGVSFYFANNEGSKIPTEVQYNKIGLIQNPYTINTTSFGAFSRTAANTFSQVLKSTVSPSVTYNVGDTVIGSTSGATGLVAFSNSSTLYLTGDKYFSSGEYVSNGTLSTEITINTIGDLYSKNIVPLYIQNVTNVQRANNQTESFRLIIQI